MIRCRSIMHVYVRRTCDRHYNINRHNYIYFLLATTVQCRGGREQPSHESSACTVAFGEGGGSKMSIAQVGRSQIERELLRGDQIPLHNCICLQQRWL